MTREQFSAAELEEFKAAQRLAYDATAAIEKELFEGMTERQAATMLEDWLGARGVTRFFHYGFAWFGDRTRFAGFAKPSGNGVTDLLSPKMAHFGKQFLPTDRPLRRGDAVILDVGPISGRAASDMGYSCTFGEPTDEFHQARMALAPYRSRILEMVQAGETRGAIYKEVDAIIADQGYENVHSYYPGGVLAHRVSRIRGLGLPTFRIKNFSAQAVAYLTGEMVEGIVRPSNHDTPLWNSESDRPCEPGLWAIEPHIGKGDIGVKWEELLVVTEDTAYWLDEDLPHVRYWAEHGVMTDPKAADTA
ncbi:M24 family metallopeptidase [Rhodococcus sp. NPDC056960]|uniref:M24 family metallopeptidase n=1 Tax=Rhodococcus sp. NPDC056960 TaxID=3345982 RepID=UPI0036284766